MEQYFLVIYIGKDNFPKLRLLTEDGIGPELVPSCTDYFKREPIYIQHGITAFYVYHPLGVKKNKLDFQNIYLSSIMATSSGDPAWSLFENMTVERSQDLYQGQVVTSISRALSERQVNPLQ